MLLTWSCLNSSQLLRTNASLLSDQHTEKANVCVRKVEATSPSVFASSPCASLETVGAGVRYQGSVVYLESVHLHQGYSVG